MIGLTCGVLSSLAVSASARVKGLRVIRIHKNAVIELDNTRKIVLAGLDIPVESLRLLPAIVSGSQIELEFEKHGMSIPVFWTNVNASEQHGPFWMYVEEPDQSGPIPEAAEIGFTVSRYQLRAWILGHKFTMAQIHKFNKMLVSAELT